MKRNKWTAEQLERLTALVDAADAGKSRPCYDTIGSELGHSNPSCRAMMSRIREERREKEADERVRSIRASESCETPLPHVAVRDQQPTSTFRYVMDSELRGRMEGQGATRGLLGDPIKGRSALDKIKAGEELPPPLWDGQQPRWIPKGVTLAQGVGEA